MNRMSHQQRRTPKPFSEFASMGDAVAQSFGHVDESTGQYIAGSATVTGLRGVVYPLTPEQKAAQAERLASWLAHCAESDTGEEMRAYYAERKSTAHVDEQGIPNWFSEE
jgi:hypothetical protein